MKKRMIITVITGAILGIFCIIGAISRSSETLSDVYLFSMWFNRLLLGMIIGMLPTNINLTKRLVRGLVVGIVVSFSFYVSTNFYDLIGFFAGGVYGIIIELLAYKFEVKKS